MSNDYVQLLRDAISRNGGCVVSLPDAIGLLHHHKSRFLAEDGGGLWVESARADRERVEEMIRSTRKAGVSFRSGVTRYVFAAPILRRESNYQVNAGMTVEAMLVQLPTEIQPIQRRANYRAMVAADSGLSARIWRIGRTTYLQERPTAAQELPVRLRDISTGGIGVNFLAKDGEPPRIAPEDRLRIELTLPEGEELILEGRLRYPLKPGKDTAELRAGIQFKQLNDDLAERQMLATLTKVVGEMQRAEARRFRLGIA
jgi:c-di-GMP-binding flagellar brake protein YcgR